MSVVPGIEVLAGRMDRLIRGRKVALLAHAASVARDYRPAWELLENAGARLQCLLSPEHGLYAEAQDMEAVGSQTQQVCGRPVPVRSLYGASSATLTPSRDDLMGADVLVVDLQDVGARYYTFAASADMAARFCLDCGLDVIVADRPNPLGGLQFEGGPGIAQGLGSFVGHFDVPHRHALTVGELVISGAGRGREGDGLTVVRAGGWERSMDAHSCALPWVVPSPNMPCLETAWVYPGACLLEGTNLSEGRGTTRPFELVGAPWLDGQALARAVRSLGLDGVVTRPVKFRPMFHKHAGKTCSGVFVHVTDRRAFRPLRAFVAILWAVRALAGDLLQWRSDAYEFRSDVPAIDLLWGEPWLREAMDSGAPASLLLEAVDEIEKRWDASSRTLLYQ